MFDAAVEAITHTDAAVGTIYEACQEAGYTLVITADHGNAEQMINLDTGAPHTAHTTNKVPFIIAQTLLQHKTIHWSRAGREREEKGWHGHYSLPASSSVDPSRALDVHHYQSTSTFESHMLTMQTEDGVGSRELATPVVCGIWMSTSGLLNLG